MRINQDLIYEKNKNSQNISAMNEILSVIKTVHNEIDVSKAAYIGSLEELKKYNADLYAKLAEQKGLIVGIYSDMTIKLDSLLSRNDSAVDYGDSTYGIRFSVNYQDSSLANKISGETKFALVNTKVVPMYTSIFSNELSIGVTYGMRELKDRYEVFCVSKSDKIKFNELDGVFTLAKQTTVSKKLRWGIGAHVGATYDFSNWKVRPYVGIGLSYNFIRF